MDGGIRRPSKTALRSTERLVGDLAAAKLRVNVLEADLRNAAQERQNFVDKVVDLEAKNRNLIKEIERRDCECMTLQKECADGGLREDMAQEELREAHLRERELAVRSVERYIAITEANNATVVAQSEAAGHLIDVKRLERDVSSKDEEVLQLRAELHEARSQGEQSKWAFQRLETEYQNLQQAKDGIYEALCDANMQLGALEAKLKSLEANLQVCAQEKVEYAQEAEQERAKSRKLQEANTRLRLDLQDAIGQAQSKKADPPFRLEIAAELATSTLPAVKSHVDYPRCINDRNLRLKILSARGEALDKIDRLMTP